MKSLSKLSLATVLALAITGMSVHAQNTNAPEKKAKHTETARQGIVPFHGKLKAVDNTAKAISVGEMTISITSDTKIVKAGKPATLADGVVGEDVGGAYKKSQDGKLTAISIRFGAKPEKTEGEKKQKEEKK